MPFAHIFADADADAVRAAMDRHFAEGGFQRIGMTRERHPTAMKTIREDRLRLFWISPRIRRWTGIFEFRYYANDARARWGMSDEHLAVALSKALGEVWRIEVADNAGFWLYARYVGGEEKEGRAYQDAPGSRTPDRSHPRYELNHIIEREGFANIGLGYENIPGACVAKIEHVAQGPEGIEGEGKFEHAAYERAEAGKTGGGSAD